MAKIPIGILNNNPTNIRVSKTFKWLGETESKGAFCKFIDRKFAYRATFILFHSYITKHGCRTLRDIINRWAPPSENQTAVYLRTVSNMSNYPEMVTVDLGDEDMMCKIVKAMVYVEVGMHENIDAIREGYKLAAASRDLRDVHEK